MDTKEIEFFLQPSLDIFERNGHCDQEKGTKVEIPIR